MSDLNVHIYCYEDLEFLKDAVAQVPDGIPIHVCDGRYADFDGDYDLTPGAAEWCDDQPGVTYHAPPADRLPFGDPDDTEHRRSVHEKSEWVNYEVLPQDEWTIKLDTDEEFTRFDAEYVPDLDPEIRYRVYVDVDEDRHFYLTRLWQPQYWTVWVNDCLLPRDEVPRYTPVEEIAEKWYDHRNERRVRIEAIRIDNRGTDRPDDYLARRADQLEDIGREGRARQLRDNVLD